MGPMTVPTRRVSVCRRTPSSTRGDTQPQFAPDGGTVTFVRHKVGGEKQARSPSTSVSVGKIRLEVPGRPIGFRLGLLGRRRGTSGADGWTRRLPSSSPSKAGGGRTTSALHLPGRPERAVPRTRLVDAPGGAPRQEGGHVDDRFDVALFRVSGPHGKMPSSREDRSIR